MWVLVLGTGPKKVYTRESQELKESIREVAGSVLVDFLSHVLNFVTTVCDTMHTYKDTQCCKVTGMYCGNQVEKSC
jgi:hypothetical protein